MLVAAGLVLTLLAPPAKTPATPAALLDSARRFYKSLDYDEVIPITERLLALPDADVQTRLDAYLLQGSSLAVVGDPIAAEAPFRFLLRGRPDFDMAPDTPPRILAVFRKVQAEERAIVQQMRELERAAIVRTLVIEGGTPKELTGGMPLAFDYRVDDPRGAVRSVRVQFRRRGEPVYSALALQVQDSRWRAELPPQWTENDAGLTIDYFVVSYDAADLPLLALGSAEAPLAVAVQPGRMEVERPWYRSWLFWTAVGAGVVAVGGVGYYAYRQGNQPPESDGGVFDTRGVLGP